MDLHYLEIFNTVAQYESYKKASDILHISQPALSVQIKKLEGQIGLKLFDKIGNRVHLSENGIILQEYTKRIFGIIDELENTIHCHPTVSEALREAALSADGKAIHAPNRKAR